jgi:hypothetical protein
MLLYVIIRNISFNLLCKIEPQTLRKTFNNYNVPKTKVPFHFFSNGKR